MKTILQWSAVMALALIPQNANAADTDTPWVEGLKGFDWAKQTSTITDEQGGTFKVRVIDQNTCETVFRHGGQSVNFGILEGGGKPAALVVGAPQEWLANKEETPYRLIIVRERPGKLSNLVHSTINLKPMANDDGGEVLVGIEEKFSMENLSYSSFMMISPVSNGDANLNSEDGTISMGAMFLVFSPQASAGAAYAAQQCTEYLSTAKTDGAE